MAEINLEEKVNEKCPLTRDRGFITLCGANYKPCTGEEEPCFSYKRIELVQSSNKIGSDDEIPMGTTD